MAGKLKLLVGFGTGYVLGTRAGRERYDQIAGKAQELWRDPRVQEKAGQAQQVVKEKADQAQQVVKEKAGQAQQVVKEKVGDKVSGNGSRSSTSSGTSAASGTTGTRSGIASVPGRARVAGRRDATPSTRTAIGTRRRPRAMSRRPVS